MWFPNNNHQAVCQAKTRRDKVASLGPFPGLRAPDQSWKNVPQQWQQIWASRFTSPWRWPQRGSITFPPVCRRRASERLGSCLFKTHLAHEPVVGPGFEAKVPGTRWLALNDPRHECTPMPFQRTANTQILSKFLQQGTWSWTKTHREITQLKSREAEDCLQPPSGALKLCFQWKLCFLSFIH